MQYNYHKNSVPSGPPATPNNTFGGVKYVYIIAIAAVLFIALVVLFFSLTSNSSRASKPLEITKSSANNVVKSSPKPQNYFKKKHKQMPDVPVSLSSIKLLDNSHEIDLDLGLSTWTAYRVHFTNEHKTLDVVLFNANVSSQKDKINKQSNSNISYTEDGIKLLGDFTAKGIKVESFSHNNDLHLILNFPKSIHLKKSHITKSHPTSLTLNFGYTKAADIVVLPEAPGAENKVKSLVVDYHDNTEALLDTAQNLLSFGRYDDAIAQIKENPVAIYEDEKACAMLIKLYLQNKSYVKAEAVASQGSTIFSNSMEIKKLWAQANFALQNYRKSFSILKENPPEITDHIEYYSLLASVALKLEKYEFASGVYRSLLAIQPSKSDYWAGLAITLQGLGKNNLALEAYHRALSTGSLSSDLIGYVRGQIRNLQ